MRACIVGVLPRRLWSGSVSGVLSRGSWAKSRILSVLARYERFLWWFLDSIMNESRDIIDSRPSRLLFIGLAKESDLSYLSYSKE